MAEGGGTNVPAGRLSRMARLGALGAGVAGRVAAGGAAEIGRGRRPVLRDLMLTPANVRRVTGELAQMRGAALKLGQLVSMEGGDLLPPELAGIMARLREDAEHMPPKQLRRVLDAQWRPGWIREFERFDVRPLAAASIGQVHRARPRGGCELAIKVQYPGVAASIDSDVANVGALLRMSGLLPRGFDLGPYLGEARAQLRAETDYAAEARHMARFGALLAGEERFRVPEPAPEWSTGAVLAMTFEPGRPIEEAARAPQAVRDTLARDLIDLTLRELLEFGVMQTDPNFANYRWDEAGGRIVLLDFGAVREVGAGPADLHRRLLRAGLAGDAGALRDLAEEVGVVGAATPSGHARRLLGMGEAVFAELRAPGPVDFGTSDLPRRLREEGIALAEDGFAPPPVPAELLHLQRKFAGMFLLAARLGARVPVRSLVEARL